MKKIKKLIPLIEKNIKILEKKHNPHKVIFLWTDYFGVPNPRLLKND